MFFTHAGGHNGRSDIIRPATRRFPGYSRRQGRCLINLTSDLQLPFLKTAFLSEKPFVTDLDLKVAMLPQGAVEYLRQAMPQMRTANATATTHTNGARAEAADGAPDEGSQAYDYETWLDRVFD